MVEDAAKTSSSPAVAGRQVSGRSPPLSVPAAARRPAWAGARGFARKGVPFIILAAAGATIVEVLFGSGLLTGSTKLPVEGDEAPTVVGDVESAPSSLLQLHDGEAYAVPGTGLVLSCSFSRLNGEPFGELQVVGAEGHVQAVALHEISMNPLRLQSGGVEHVFLISHVDYKKQTALLIHTQHQLADATSNGKQGESP